jgi:hypothetical protein
MLKIRIWQQGLNWTSYASNINRKRKPEEVRKRPCDGCKGVGHWKYHHSDSNVEQRRAEESQKQCAYWLVLGRCNRGKACPDRHVEGKQGTGKVNKPCRKWASGEECSMKPCKFQHEGKKGDGKSQPAPKSGPAKKVCQFFKKGTCTKGKACAFAHPAIQRATQEDGAAAEGGSAEVVQKAMRVEEDDDEPRFIYTRPTWTSDTDNMQRRQESNDPLYDFDKFKWRRGRLRAIAFPRRCARATWKVVSSKLYGMVELRLHRLVIVVCHVSCERRNL